MNRTALLLGVAVLLGAEVLRAEGPQSFSDEDVAGAVLRLADPDYATREEASRRLLGWGTSEPERLRKLLPDKAMDPEVQERLAQLRLGMIRGFLLQRVEKEASAPARMAAGDFLKLPTRAGLLALVKAAGPGKRALVAEVCLFLMEKEPLQRAPLIEAIQCLDLDPEHELGLVHPEGEAGTLAGSMAFDTLILLHPPSALRAAELLMEDADPKIRMVAAEGMVELVTDPRTSAQAGKGECAQRLAKDPDPDVSAKARYALALLAKPGPRK